MNDFINWFDREFKTLHADWRASIAQLDQSNFYSANEQRLSPAAEQILRSARIVEQTFGGITANLWDDPFEWTLPETLTTRDKLIGYLDDVRDARERGFRLFQEDQDLLKSVMAPQGSTQLISLLLDCLVQARLQAKQWRKKSAGQN
ncbi:MAG TPA: hypothetical protein VE863_06795 [Pyrinomonadaceae bacterium]|jgi:hypothetical protein|nr:hypothetical protein [Pyrinomonadaceae bacterium]